MKCPCQATILWQFDGPVHQDVDPAPVMIEQTARMMRVVWKLKAIELGQHWRRFPTADCTCKCPIGWIVLFGRPETLRKGSEFAVPYHVEQQN